MTALDILTQAYADIFGIEVEHSGNYYDQQIDGTMIDYASFSRSEALKVNDDDYFEAMTEDGSEGCYIGIFLVHYVGCGKSGCGDYARMRAGTIKTLEEGRDAWKHMGALAGMMAYMANGETFWKLLKAEKAKA